MSFICFNSILCILCIIFTNFFPEMPPRGLTAWVVQQLPHYLLSLEGGTCQEGWTGAQRRSGSPGARSAAGGEDPPPLQGSGGTSQGLIFAGAGDTTATSSFISLQPRPSPQRFSTHPPGGRRGRAAATGEGLQRSGSARSRAGSGHRNLRPQDQFPAGIPSLLGQWWLNSPLERRPPRVT